ncbi:MAG: desulfoferrodoxin family protein [Spirochaetota bacterium]
MNIFICQVCGLIEFNAAPEKCPVCGALKSSFKQNDNIFKESAEKSPEAPVKHIPVLTVNKSCALIPEQSCADVLFKIGKTLHPMEEKHFIQWADCYLNNKFIERIQFTPFGVNPAGCLHIKELSGTITIVENCNIHGYWKADIVL